MMIILSFRPNNTLSTQSVWFIFMYTFNRINFQRIQLNCRYTLDDTPHTDTMWVHIIHANRISLNVAAFPLVYVWSCHWAFYTTSFNSIAHFCQEFLNFLVLSRPYFSFKFIRLKTNYIHLHNLCASYHFIL